MNSGPNQKYDGRGDVFLCGTPRHLLMSLATIAQVGLPSTVIYLEDRLPIPDVMRARLALACPQTRFVYTSDAEQITAFARLPRIWPNILRRNVTLGGPNWITRPNSWQSPVIKDQKFETGYVYHSVFFMAKVLAGRCNQMVLREDGLSNYVGRKVPPLKAVLRWLSGLSPRNQIWGEEKWINRIEVSRPDDLPASVRAKAVRLTFQDVMDVLSAPEARAIGVAFLPYVPPLAQKARTAILLTQPLHAVGICSSAQRSWVYGQIADQLRQAGYSVYVKPHPTEAGSVLSGTTALPPAFPVEVWPYISDQKFSLAVALCSAALVSGARLFADQTTQLLHPDVFNAHHFAEWPGLIGPALALALRDNTKA